MIGAVLVLVALQAPAAAQDVIARDAWMRVPPPSKDETALYLVIENRSPKPVAVVGASSNAAEKLELHEMRMVGRLMSMNQLQRIPVPARGKTELRSGGVHIMVFGLKERPAVGDSVAITLTLEDGTTVPVIATVRK
jgi:copper(I)-binding protein